MNLKCYSKEELVFGRKENKEKYLIYSAKTRGIHIVSKRIYRVWKECDSSSISEICHKTKFSEKDIKKILSLLIKRNLIEVD
jgi:hypothetical protein